MTTGVFLAVLFAALLHATWNALVRAGVNKSSAMTILTAGQACCGLVVAMIQPFPAAEVWPWLIASGIIHLAYQMFLLFAYEQGDLSRVYPIARGTAPMIVLLFGALFLADVIAPNEVLGVLVLGLGIVLMAAGALRSGESRRLVPYALASALATAAYSIVDGLGARISGDPAAFVAWEMLISGAMFAPVIVWLRGRAVLRVSGSDAIKGGVAAVASYAAYAISVWAMTQAPIALVTALRETSIFFAMLIGGLIFREPMDRPKVIAALLIVAGVALTRL
jgi:drug/metabolite transporter (DMT)-like permease